MNMPLLSLCLPTNGISEWVFPVLDSIYSQKVDNSLFEIIVTDNGQNEEFMDRMLNYEQTHENLVYKKTDVYMFYNQLEALKLASGQYLKFVNHRTVLVGGALEKMIDIIRENFDTKPIMYFSNGVLKQDYSVDSFDKYVRVLGEYASWTTGVGIWKSDYDSLPLDLKIDRISPHSCILFANRDRDSYKVMNFKYCEEIDQGHSQKGIYDLFKAFGVEELSITQNLYIDGDITASTFKKVKNDYKNLLAGFYWSFCIRKKPCSYDLSGFDDAMGIYFCKMDIIIRAYLVGIKSIFKKIRRK